MTVDPGEPGRLEQRDTNDTICHAEFQTFHHSCRCHCRRHHRDFREWFDVIDRLHVLIMPKQEKSDKTRSCQNKRFVHELFKDSKRVSALIKRFHTVTEISRVLA